MTCSSEGAWDGNAEVMIANSQLAEKAEDIAEEDDSVSRRAIVMRTPMRQVDEDRNAEEL